MIRTLKRTAILMSFIFASSAFTCTIDGQDGFLPENNLRIPVGLKRAGGITEVQFNNVIDKLETIYAPVVASLGANLNIKRLWTNATVNASAMQVGKNWEVNMYGGLARHETITQDGFSLVLCHEIGHHIGGAPKKVPILFSGKWASNEGQSDYFATLKCLRKLFVNDNNVSIVSTLNAPKHLVDSCKKATKNDKEDSALCIRTSMAGKSVANLFSVLRKLPETKFETPDPKVVKSTFDSHPLPQCRLDTYFQGSLCDVGMNEPQSNTDEVKGTCHASLGHKVGTRPLCWFKPSVL